MRKFVMLAVLALGLSTMVNAETIPAKKQNAKEVTTSTSKKRKAKKAKKAKKAESTISEGTAKK